MKKYFLLFLPVIGIAAILFAPSDAVSAGAQALDFCLKSIVPSLLPFLVFSSLAVSSGLADICAKVFDKIMKPLFGVPGECAVAFILGLISGFPVGAKTAAELYEDGKCTRSQAEKMLAFCNGASPAFVIGTVGGVLWNDVKTGVLLFAAQTAALVITGMVFGRIKNGDRLTENNVKQRERKNIGFLSAVVSAVMSSALTALYISAFIVFFAVVSEILMHYGIIPAIAQILAWLTENIGFNQTDVETLLCGFVEFSTGVKNAVSDQTGLKQAIMTALILGWSGLSVHCQVAATAVPQGLSIKKYVCGKAMCGVISAAITFALYILINR